METKTVLVVDVPEKASPEQAEALLNAPGDSYFLVHVLPVASGHRAYLRRYKQTPPTKAEAEKGKAANLDDATGLSIVRANRDKSIREIVSLLDRAGIKRGRQWVCDKLDATCAEDGKEERALDYVKMFPKDPPSDIVFGLQHVLKIKRSVSWARRKLEEVGATVRRDNS